jgi:putative oxidoreductase
MKIAVIVCRFLLGLGFTVFGLNIIHSFLPQPPIPEGSNMAIFMNLMVPTHYMLVVGLFQFIGGILVLIGGTAPFGLVLLAPVLVNILCFHIFLMGGEGLVPGLVFTSIEIFLIYAYRNHFKPLFTTHAKPAV